MCTTIASAITAASPAAAHPVSAGRRRVSPGSTRPSAPASSTTPMNRTSPSGSAPVHGAIFAISAIGRVACVSPATPKAAASNPCATQRPTCNLVRRPVPLASAIS